MINDAYVEKLIRLINAGLIVVSDIKDPAYKTEVESRLTAAQ